MNAIQQAMSNDNQTMSLDTQMTNYYQLHARIYDATRWTFLFGRQWLLDWLPFNRADKFTIVEVGCGTGFNLQQLARRYYKAKLIGIDVAKPMLDIARKKSTSIHNTLIFKKIAYGTEESLATERPDAVLFSYCLTMVNPDWETLVLQAKSDLSEGGCLAVVDFHDSPFALFRRWMRFNHVRMEGQVLPFLEAHFSTVKIEKRKAYFGLWTYFLFIGKR